MRLARVCAPIAACVLAAAVLTGCTDSGSEDLQSLRMAGEVSPFGAAIPHVPAGQPFTFAGIWLCVSDDEEVTITGVAPVEGQDLKVVDFATLEGVSEFGSDLVDLRTAGFDPAQRTVSTDCATGGTKVAVEFQRSDASGPGTAESFVISYRTPSGTGTTEVPFELRLCPGETLDTSCAPTSR